MLDTTKTISESEFRKYIELGVVKDIRVFMNPNKSFSLAVRVKLFPQEQILISKRHTQREWTSLDRLLQSLERFGIPVCVDFSIPIHENPNEPSSH